MAREPHVDKRRKECLDAGQATSTAARGRGQCARAAHLLRHRAQFRLQRWVANLTLEAVRFTMPVQGTITGERVAVAHLRTSVEGLRQLKVAIEGIEAMIQGAPDSKKN